MDGVGSGGEANGLSRDVAVTGSDLGWWRSSGSGVTWTKNRMILFCPSAHILATLRSTRLYRL